MDQFLGAHPRSSESERTRILFQFGGARYDSYWKFIDISGRSKNDLQQMLLEAGFTPDMGWQKRRLVEELRRVRVARLRYNRPETKTKDLLHFVRDRGLLMPEQGQRRALVEVLCHADLYGTFARLNDLPPELRSRIYSMYLSEFADVLELPTQPPLARASRQLRKEVLPLFYQTTTFKLTMVHVSSCKDDPHGKKLRFDIWTSSFLHSIPADLNGCLRKIQVTIGKAQTALTPRFKIDEKLIFDVDVNKTEASRVELRDIFSPRDAVQQFAWRDVLSKTVDDICEKQTTKGLRASDISSLRKAAEVEYFAAEKARRK